MKRIIILTVLILVGIKGIGQSTENGELIKLAKAYKDKMFRNKADKKYLKKFNKSFSNSLQQEAKFIKQTITTKNKLLKKDYLTVPNKSTLKNIYIIRQVNFNLREETEITPNQLIDSLKKKEIPRYELIDSYYSMLFTSVGNKNQPFNLKKIDFNLEEYGLQDDVEKGIFFLKCMSFCGTNIWGYMNVVKPPNTKKALSFINKYPKFNGNTYYQFSDLYFKDFEMVIIEEDGLQSYKSYYLDKYFETLLSHLVCLNKEGGSEKEIRNLLLGSILSDEKLYKYTKHKETLESIFQKKDRD
ncbi:MAG: hypothetical protein AB8H03_19825 [Saprospiraceae bacterium]